MLMATADGQDGDDPTWCERRLLARMHRYSRERRRRAARPVSPAAFMRFLCHWHGFDEPAEELEQALAQLEGWTAPLAAWEPGLLMGRCADYAAARFDALFLSGSLTWFRPPQGNGGQLVAATPIAIVPRANAHYWRGEAVAEGEATGGAAGRLAAILEREGPMFTADLAEASGLLPTQLEQGIAELVARGRITSDAFSPLRWLVRPEAEKRRRESQLRRRRGGNVATSMLGRWSLARPQVAASRGEAPLFPEQVRLAAVCEALLQRYGVVFRAVLERESLAPPWRELLRWLRRMEDRGEVHGGRFVDGFSGEQFALPEAVGLLRGQAARADEGMLTVISACDPLNLGGIVTPGPRTAARAGNRVLLLDGEPVARLQGDDLEMLGDGVPRAEAERRLRVVRALQRRV